jgi:hypothetical protein
MEMSRTTTTTSRGRRRGREEEEEEEETSLNLTVITPQRHKNTNSRDGRMATTMETTMALRIKTVGRDCGRSGGTARLPAHSEPSGKGRGQQQKK